MTKRDHTNKKSSAAAQRLAQLFEALAARPLWMSYALALALGTFIIYLPYMYVVTPVKAESDVLRKSIGEKKAKNDAADLVRSNEQQFNKDFAELYLIAEEAHRLLPPKAEATKALEGVQAIAQNSKLKVIRFSAARPPVQSGKLFEIAVTTQLSGKSRDIARFLSALASHERIINVTAFNESNTGSEQTVGLDLSTYYAPPPKDLPAFPEDIITLAETGK